MDDIIQLWIAQGYIDIPLIEVKRIGIIGKKVPETKEGIGRLWFEEFYGLGVIKLSHLDSSTGRLRYKLNPTFVDQLQGHPNKNHCYFRLDDDNAYISDNTLHASLRDSVDLITLNDLYQAKKLYTLLILHKQGSHLDQIPRDLFLKLPSLRALDLSHTCISELPSSIGNLGDLNYLILSGTPITTLPDSLCSLYQIQTLKLRGCLKLLNLPKGMSKLVDLRHLDVDVSCLINSMPPEFGNLVELQTLPAFIISEENGCHITELKNLVNLHGTFRILRLENVSNSKEAKEAALYQKEHLDKLELHWTELQDGLKLLEYLQPHTQVKELQIVGYGGAKFPSWIGNDSFSILTSITIHDCRNCEVLPPLGKLPSLKTLCLSNMIAVKTIDSRFCGRDTLTGVRDFVRFRGKRSASNTSVAFLTLETLTLKSLLSLEKWSGMKELDFPSLKKLKILDCPKLTALRKISLLNDLKTLEISFCPSLTLPNEGLPTSLQHLVITDCAVLKDRCHKDIGKDWLKIAHIPDIWIDYQHISQSLKGITVPRLSTSYVDNNKDASNDLMFKPRGDPTENPNDDQEKNNRDTTAPSKPTSFLSNLILNPFKSFRLKVDTIPSTQVDHFTIAVDSVPSTLVESVPSAEVNSGNEKIPGSPLRVPGSPHRMPGTPFRVPPSPSQFPMSPQINRIGSVHLNMSQVFKATQNFSPSLIIGEGGFGTVYKAQLQDGQVVAIKRAKKEHINIPHAEFSSEVELLARIEHRNLVRLLGYLEKWNERIIITENVPNGTLREHLDGQHENILDFNQRLEIAIDVAHALTYLHLYAEIIVSCQELTLKY